MCLYTFAHVSSSSIYRRLSRLRFLRKNTSNPRPPQFLSTRRSPPLHTLLMPSDTRTPVSIFLLTSGPRANVWCSPALEGAVSSGTRLAPSTSRSAFAVTYDGSEEQSRKIGGWSFGLGRRCTYISPHNLSRVLIVIPRSRTVRRHHITA
jgi:hypothetical protein